MASNDVAIIDGSPIRLRTCPQALSVYGFCEVAIPSARRSVSGDTAVCRLQIFRVGLGSMGWHLEPPDVHLERLVRLAACVSTFPEEGPRSAAQPRRAPRHLLRLLDTNNLPEVPGFGYGVYGSRSGAWVPGRSNLPEVPGRLI